MKKGTQVVLSQELVTEAYEIGKQRHLANRKKGVSDQQVSKASWYMIDGEGACGEFAFAQMVRANPTEWARIRDISVRSAELRSDFGDCRYLGYNFDVKVTRYETGHLILAKTKRGNFAEAYALFTGMNGLYVFRGVISRAKIMKHISEFKYHEPSDSIWISQEWLSDLPEDPNKST